MRRNYMNRPMNRNRNNQNSIITDYGNDPFIINIEKATNQNSNFRSTLWTGTYMQVTLMSIEPKESIGLENHSDNDQFLRIEKGFAQVIMGKNKDNMAFRKNVTDGFAIFIPAGIWHNVINIGKTPLKIYSIYAPTHHPRSTVHKTKSESLVDEGIVQTNYPQVI